MNRTATTEHDVLVVGGGPVGLMTAVELGRRGVDVGLVERRAGRLHHPRALGVHAPHVALTRVRDGAAVSTVDVLHTDLVLLTDPAGVTPWRDAVDRLPVPVVLYVIGPGGAVLVRPDGHVAYRAPSLPPEPAAELGTVLDRILAR